MRLRKVGDFKNEFSWSKSRDDLFQYCKRKYYYQYYGYWDGWNKDSPSREIYILKNLINKQMWIGQVVHDGIKNLLLLYKASMDISLSNLLNRIKDRLNTEFSISKSKFYRQFPKKVGLFEHEYDLLITKDEWDETFKSAEDNIKNFYNSDILQLIKKTNTKNWIFLEDFLSFDYDGTKIYLQIDFAMKEEGKISIFDWKTGQERDDAKIGLQLSSYSFYVLQKWNLSPEKIEVKVYNINLDKLDSFNITNEIINKTKEYIQSSISGMKSLLTDQTNNIANIENFPLTENKLKCSNCNFKRLCDR